jgi:hypothetical protein
LTQTLIDRSLGWCRLAFRRAARSQQQSGIPTSLFFENADPDEVELIRSFEAVMAESGLDFEVDTPAGFEVAWCNRVAL